MGLMDFIKGQLLEIIEWTDDSRDTLSYRWPDDDKEIKNGAVRMARVAKAPAATARSGCTRRGRPPTSRCSTCSTGSPADSARRGKLAITNRVS